jgi:hypothetical protein
MPSDIADKRANNAQSSALVQQGYVEIAAGLSNLFPQGSSAAAGVMRGGEEAGASMAAAMKDRYYKKEFELVRKTRVEPLVKSMQDDLETFRAQVTPTMRPVQRTVNAHTGQLLGETIAGGSPTTVEVPTGKMRADGTPITDIQQQGAPPAFNPAFGQPGQIGAVETYDAMSIVDPATGQPVDLDDPRARDIHDQLTNAIWDRYGQANNKLLDLFGEYQGNPYADNAMKGILMHTAQISGEAATAEQHPDKQAAMMQQRAKLHEEIQGQHQVNELNRQRAEANQGQLEAGSRMAGQAASDPQWSGLFTPEERSSLGSNQPQAPAAAARASALYGDILAREKLMAAAAKTGSSRSALSQEKEDHRRGLTPIAPGIMHDVTMWPGSLADDDGRFQGLHTERVLELAAGTTGNLAHMPVQDLIQAYANVGAPAEVLAALQSAPNADGTARASVFAQDNVKPFTLLIAQADPSISAHATADAMQIRVSEAIKLQPGVERAVRDNVDAYLARMRLQGIEIPPQAEALIRADAPRLITEIALGRSVEAYRSPTDEAAYGQTQHAIAQQRALVEADEDAKLFDFDAERLANLNPKDDPDAPPPADGRPVGSWDTSAPGLPAPGQEIKPSPTNEESDPNEPEPDNDADDHKFLGMDVDQSAPIPELFNAIREAAKVRRPIGENIPLGAQPKNPYTGLDPQLLMNLLMQLPNNPGSSPVRQMLIEAIDAAPGSLTSGGK